MLLYNNNTFIFVSQIIFLSSFITIEKKCNACTITLLIKLNIFIIDNKDV